jgi:hypothetical protein
MRNIYTIADPAVIASGIFPSLGSGQDALWRQAENVLFYKGKVEPLQGNAILQTAAGSVIEIAQAFVEPDSRIYFGTTAGVYQLQNNVVSQISTQSAARWDFETWGSWLIATNNQTAPLVSKNNTSSIPLANAPARVGMFRKLANHLIALDVDGSGQQIAWSSLSDIETWAPLPENTAGDLFLRDLDSGIRAAVNINSSLLIYSVDSVGVLEYIGAPNFFGFRKRFSGIGAVSKNSVVEYAGLHYGLGRKGFFKTDGNSFQLIHNPAVYKWLEDEIDWHQAATVCAWFDSYTECVFWSFTAQNGQRKGLAFNVASGAWMPIRLNLLAASSSSIFSYSVVGIGNTICAWNRPGTSVSWFIESGWLDFGSDELWKRISMLELRGENQAAADLQVLHCETTDLDVTPETIYSATAAKQNFIDRDAVQLKFRLSGTGGQFTLSAFNIFGAAGGFR